MATLMDDGSLLIMAAIDGPFEEVSAEHRRVEAGVVRRQAFDPFELSPVRTKQLSQEQRQAAIKQRIKEMQEFDKTLTFAKAWTVLRSTRPDLFDR